MDIMCKVLTLQMTSPIFSQVITSSHCCLNFSSGSESEDAENADISRQDPERKQLKEDVLGGGKVEAGRYLRRVGQGGRGIGGVRVFERGSNGAAGRSGVTWGSSGLLGHDAVKEEANPPRKIIHVKQTLI